MERGSHFVVFYRVVELSSSFSNILVLELYFTRTQPIASPPPRSTKSPATTPNVANTRPNCYQLYGSTYFVNRAFWWPKTAAIDGFSIIRGHWDPLFSFPGPTEKTKEKNADHPRHRHHRKPPKIITVQPEVHRLSPPSPPVPSGAMTGFVAPRRVWRAGVEE